MTCSADQVIETDPGRALASLTLPPVASVSDNVGVASLSVEFNGSVYAPSDNIILTLSGSPHTLGYVAIDTAGNMARCSLIVSVVGECLRLHWIL